MRVTLEQDVFVMLQVLAFDKFLISNLFEEEFEQAFRKRVDIVTDIDLILVGCARNELFSKSYGAQGSNDATWCDKN